MLAHAVVLLGVVLLPSDANAQEFGGFACAPAPGEVEAAIATHASFQPRLLHEFASARDAFRNLSNMVQAARRGHLVLSPSDHAALVAAHGQAQQEVRRLDEVRRAWAACHAELAELRRFYSRAAHPLRLSLGFDGALWNMLNRDDDLTEDGFDYVIYRAPSAALQLGWEHYYSRRVGLRVNGTVALGQGRFRACSLEQFIHCYGQPAAGTAFTAAVDVGLRVWVARIFTIGLSIELRITRLPITERIQNGNRYAVSDRVVPAALLRLSPEFLLTRDGRWWVSPSVGYGRMLTQRGGVSVAALQLGYSL